MDTLYDFLNLTNGVNATTNSHPGENERKSIETSHLRLHNNGDTDLGRSIDMNVATPFVCLTGLLTHVSHLLQKQSNQTHI